MAVKLSDFLSTSLADALDSAATVAIIQDQIIPLDSNTSGDYIKDITAGSGILVTGGGAHSATPTVKVDSSSIATLTGSQTLTNKTINFADNSVTTSLAQLNAALSGGVSVASLSGTETLTNKTLTAPTITGPNITGPGSITDISTFGLRDVTTTTHETRIVSNNVSPILSADRTLTLDVNNADRNISLTGNLTLGGSLTTSGAHATTLTTTGVTGVTLPTSGTLISKDGSGDVSIAGTMTANSYEGDGSSLTGISSYTLANFDSDLASKTTADLTEGSNLYYTDARVDTVLDNTTTDSISEGSTNLYYTTARANTDFDNRLATKSTTNLSEGTNLYYTTVRFDSDFGDNTTSNLTEGTNLYFTNARARAAVGASGDLSYNSSTGVFSIDVETIYTKANFDSDLGDASTSDLPEGTNLYYTTARVDSDITAKVDGAFVNNLTIDADTLGGQNSAYHLNYNNFTNTPTIGNATISISAGSGLATGGSFTTNAGSNSTITLAHADTSTLTGNYGGNDDGIVIEDITVDGFGHITAISTRDLDGRFANTGGATFTGQVQLNDNVNLDFGTGNDAEMYFDNSQLNLDINGDHDFFIRDGNNSNANRFTFDVSAGDFTATGNVTAYSDERLKENIRTIDNALDKVDNMRGVYYDKDGRAETGVIAQEIERVLPEVVIDGAEYKSVAYGNVVGILIEAIKELKQEIEDLKSGDK